MSNDYIYLSCGWSLRKHLFLNRNSSNCCAAGGACGNTYFSTATLRIVALRVESAEIPIFQPQRFELLRCGWSLRKHLFLNRNSSNCCAAGGACGNTHFSTATLRIVALRVEPAETPIFQPQRFELLRCG